MTTAGDPVHGGPDAMGVPAHDFSTNGNACGPCPDVQAALRAVDATHYPDPTYTVLRERLAVFHGVTADRIVVAASASEFIFRITAVVAQRGGSVVLPALAYGDYERAARAFGMPVQRDGEPVTGAHLVWRCEPSSPLGQSDPHLGTQIDAMPTDSVCVLDRAYEPLRLGAPTAGLTAARLDRVWQLWTPNKALGLTGIRAAYAIAPAGARRAVDAMERLAPSWPLGSHGVALLDHWTRESVQQWLAASLQTLRSWSICQRELCAQMGWECLPSEGNFFCASPPVDDVSSFCASLRTHGVKLRDAASFGLPNHVRLSVQGPVSQAALASAVKLLS